MSDDNLYKNRILSKARKHNLFSKRCTEFAKTEKNKCDHILSRCNLLGEPLLVFWSSEDLWTLLSTMEVVSEINASVNYVRLDDINRIVKIEEVDSKKYQATKLQSEFLRVGNSGTRIWAPQGAEIFSLWNILLRFPIKPMTA